MSIISKDRPRHDVHMPADGVEFEHPEGDWHALTRDEVLQKLDSHEAGLSNDEVLQRREKYGPNKLAENPPVPRWVRFLEQFQDPMVYLLIIAAIIAFIFEKDDVATPIFIVIALTLNAFFGYLQESKAEQAMASLKKLLVSHCVALRDGSEFKVTIDELVPGDVIWLEDGLNVPADVRIIDVHQLLVDESSLTGESNVIHKQIDPVSADSILQEQSNMAFMGTVVSSGRAKAIVTRIGMNTMLGSIASGISEVTTPRTPLEVKLHSLGRFLGGIAVTCAALLLLLQVVKNWFGPSADSMYDVIAEQFLVSVVIFVAIVPEGLPIILVISLSMGMRNMAKQKAIVRKMKAVETLGSTTIICTDKTGTLTRNEMTVRAFLVNGVSYGVSGHGFDPTLGKLQKGGKDLPESELAELHTDIAFRQAIATCLLCQNSNLNLIEDEWQSVGDPTDSACAVFGWKLKESYRRSHPRFREFTFDRTRKRMTTIHEFDAEKWAFSKGALGPFMGIATHIYEDGDIVPLEGRHKDVISEINLEYASRALRVLALCARRITEDVDIDSVEAVEDQMIFLGLVGIMDPPRPEVLFNYKMSRSRYTCNDDYRRSANDCPGYWNRNWHCHGRFRPHEWEGIT